ncbi:Tudor/PWWP/MBT [Pluteus cervinus]|uniref:Tudor/PWWP/MBT n=1 Tax=Pluteus cervinus TaxID=181527 RepID=A0ACD3A8N0_9AGAR|nr:Tudor/PWWP/MBT [Pluteus cervinus]
MSKKGAKQVKEMPSYQTRDVVLGKVRGYPPWPGMVVDPDGVPPGVAKERPAAKKIPFYCVRFFPTGDFAWLSPQDISKLQTHEIESYINEPYRKSGDLLNGYRIALDPTKWEEEQAQNAAVDEEPSDEVDQLASEEDEDGESKKSAKSKKRKRESDAATASSKAKKAPKSKVEPTKKSTGGKGRKNGTKSKAMVESEDEGDQAEAEGEDEPAGSSRKASPPPTKKTKRDKEDEGDDASSLDPEANKVREWRHRLQKTFLSNKQVPKNEDMPGLDQLFTTVENYEQMNIHYLSHSKIGKVMRHIAILEVEKVPRDAEFHFRDRAKALVDKWHQILNANKPNGSENGGLVSERKDDKEEGVTSATAALDLNGKTEAISALSGGLPADASLADITMDDS